MKKLLLIPAILLLSVISSFAQPRVSGSHGTQYCELVVFQPWFKNHVAQMHSDGNTAPGLTWLRDAAGSKIRFASEADALNYVTKQGWELVSSYYHNKTHFFLKKEI